MREYIEAKIYAHPHGLLHVVIRTPRANLSNILGVLAALGAEVQFEGTPEPILGSLENHQSSQEA